MRGADIPPGLDTDRPSSAETINLIWKERPPDFRRLLEMARTDQEREAHRRNRVVQMRLGMCLAELDLQQSCVRRLWEVEEARFLVKRRPSELRSKKRMYLQKSFQSKIVCFPTIKSSYGADLVSLRESGRIPPTSELPRDLDTRPISLASISAFTKRHSETRPLSATSIKSVNSSIEDMRPRFQIPLQSQTDVISSIRKNYDIPAKSPTSIASQVTTRQSITDMVPLGPVVPVGPVVIMGPVVPVGLGLTLTLSDADEVIEKIKKANNLVHHNEATTERLLPASNVTLKPLTSQGNKSSASQSPYGSTAMSDLKLKYINKIPSVTGEPSCNCSAISSHSQDKCNDGSICSRSQDKCNGGSICSHARDKCNGSFMCSHSQSKQDAAVLNRQRAPSYLRIDKISKAHASPELMKCFLPSDHGRSDVADSGDTISHDNENGYQVYHSGQMCLGVVPGREPSVQARSYLEKKVTNREMNHDHTSHTTSSRCKKHVHK